MSLTREIPVYQCHKTVQALKISAVIDNPRGYELHFEDDRFAPIEVLASWVDKHDPKPGGYFVVYGDGYKSFSPATAFEAGYTPAGELPPPVQIDVERLMNSLTPETAAVTMSMAESYVQQVRALGPIGSVAMCLAIGIAAKASEQQRAAQPDQAAAESDQQPAETPAE